MDGAMRCLNCNNELKSNEGKLFAEVLVCSRCFVIAERIQDRGHQLLKRLSLLLRDTLRWAMTSGRLRFPVDSNDDIDDGELLRRIVGLYTEQTKCQTPALFTKSFSPSAPPATPPRNS